MNDDTTPWLGRLLNMVGVVAVGSAVWLGVAHGREALWVGVVATAGLLCWGVGLLLPGRLRGRGAWLLIPMVLAGSVVAVPTDGTGMVIVAVAVMVSVSDVRRPLWFALGLAALGAGLVPAGIAVNPTITPLAVLSIEGGLVLALLLGLSRRQYRRGAAQARLLAEERLSVREEQARGATLAERQRMARDIHDVLAHSLGGLVVQLDAADALLEAGRPDDARTRVSEARALAASGLDEARKAVGALRGPRDEPQAGEQLVTTFADLAEIHRGLGGRIAFDSVGEPHEVGAAQAQALHRAMQEALTNARKHAPGAAVTAALHWWQGGVELRIENPLRPQNVALPHSGQHGLVGMRERFAELDRASLTAGSVGGRFVVTARVGAP